MVDFVFFLPEPAHDLGHNRMYNCRAASTGKVRIQQNQNQSQNQS